MGDCARYAMAGTVVVVLGLIMGYDAAGVLEVLAAMLLVIAFAFGLSWVFTTVGLIMRTPSAVLNTGFMALFPLIFLSNIFVQPDTLPSALETFVSINPVSHLVTAVRGLMGGSPDGGDIMLAAGEAAALTAVFATLTVRLYRRT
jgi:ABC-2 type transport system permease protein